MLLDFRERNLQLVDTSKFTDYIGLLTDDEAPTSSVFLLEGTIRTLVGTSDQFVEGGETEEKKETLFEEKVLDPLCAVLQESGRVRLLPQKDGRLYRKEPLDRRRNGYRFVWKRAV